MNTIVLVVLGILIFVIVLSLICYINVQKAKHWLKHIVKYLDEYADKNNIQRKPKQDYIDVLTKYCEIAQNKGYELQFRERRTITAQSLNASAGLFKCEPIVMSPLWAAKLIYATEQDKQMIGNAIIMTIKHELAHKTDVNWFFAFPRYHKAIRTINEVYADFRSVADYELDDGKAAFLKLCNFRKNSKKESDEIEKWVDVHPPWSKRTEYVANNNFDAKLIKKIIDDMPNGEKYKKYTAKIIELYEDKFIILDNK